MESIQSLIGYQRAEFDIAAKLFRRKFGIQASLAAVGASSILVVDSETIYWMAAISLVIMLVWLWLELKYRSVRSNAERARRATLIMGGLGKPISLAELNDIQECLVASEEEAKIQEDPDYFASNSPAGAARLSEILEESTYWTLNLQRVSARVMWFAFVVVLLGSGGSFLALLPSASSTEMMTIARVICSILVFAVGADLFGAARAYSDTVRTLDRLMHRFDSAKARGYPEADLLLMLSDYNAAVENTPLNLPLVYAFKKKKLNQNWARRRAASVG